MSASPDTTDNTDAVVGFVFFGLLALGVLYGLTLFIAGSVGIVKQVAHPAAHHDFNPIILAWAATPLVALAYLITPEFGRRYSRRVPVAAGAAAVGTIAFIIASIVLAPSIERPSALEFLAGGLGLFIAYGIMPTLALARVATHTYADVVVAGQGDHFIDPHTLERDTASLVRKHCGPEMRRPQSWRPVTLWGDNGRLTHADLEHVFRLEGEEEQRLAELYRLQTLNEKQRTAADAFSQLAHHREWAEQELAALRGEVARVTAEAERVAQADQAALAKTSSELAAERATNADLRLELAMALMASAADVAGSAAAEAALKKALNEATTAQTAAKHENTRLAFDLEVAQERAAELCRENASLRTQLMEYAGDDLRNDMWRAYKRLKRQCRAPAPQRQPTAGAPLSACARTSSARGEVARARRDPRAPLSAHPACSANQEVL